MDWSLRVCSFPESLDTPIAKLRSFFVTKLDLSEGDRHFGAGSWPRAMSAAAAALAARRGLKAESEAKAVRQRYLEENARKLREELNKVKGRPDIMFLIRVARAERLASGDIQEPEPPSNYRIGLERDPPAEEVIGDSGKSYGYRVLCRLRVSDQPRKMAIYIVESRPFDPIILLTILANCCTMAWQSPMDPCCTPKEDFINLCEWIYLYIFTFELMVKIVAYGFLLHPGAYLRDAWCQLDFVVVSLAWLPILFPSMGNYSVIRSVRALRPLRALKRVPGMPVLVASIMSVFPKLGNVGALCGFIFLVFGIVGMELFKGTLHYRCALPGFVETADHPLFARRLWEEVGFEEVVGGGSELLGGGGGELGGVLGGGAVLGGGEVLASLGGNLSELLVGSSSGSSSLGGGSLSSSLGSSLGASFASLGGSLVITGRALKGQLEQHKGPLTLPDGTLLPYGMTKQDKYDTDVSCSPSKGPNVCIANEAPKNSTCHYFDRDPNAGMTSFDSIGLAFIILLQTVTFDSWASPMYQMMFAFSPYVWIYFLAICMLGGFFVVNLFLAVIFQQFIAASMVDRATGDMNARADLKSAVLEGGARGEGAQDDVPDGAPDGALDGAQYGAADTSVLLESGQERSDGEVGGGGRHCCDCEPEPGTWRHAVGEVATSDAVGNFSTGLVLFNMLLMVLPYEGMTEEYAMNLENASTVVTYIFIVEMFAKLLGIGCANYWADGWNQLDGTIVCMSILEIVLTILFAGGGANLSFLRIMRMLRVLRMLRLMRSWKGLYKIVSTFGKALPQMSNLLVLLTLIMTIFSLLGMQIFGAQYTPAVGFSDVPCPSGVCPNKMLSEHPYYQFDYFGPAMLTVFILMTGEWMDAMMPAIQAIGKSSCLFFIICMLVGKYLIMNLLVAILLNAFADDSGDDDGKSSGRASGRASGRSTRRSNASNESDESSIKPYMPIIPTEEVKWPRDYSLFCFSPYSPTRKFTNWLIARPEFDQIVILAILASSVCLAVDNPRLDPTSMLNLRLAQLDYFWTFFFSVEMLLKVISFSFCGGAKSYITNPWNILDLIIVSISYLVLLAEIFPVFAPLKTLRILRVLRPLRLISRHPGMKLIVSSVIKSLPSVANVMGVCMMLQLVFAILGMQMFSGMMASCTKTDITVRDLCYDPTKFSGPAYLGGEPLPGYARDRSGNLVVPVRDGFVAGAADNPMALDVSAAAIALPAEAMTEAMTEVAGAVRRQLKGAGDSGWKPGDPVLWQNSARGSFDNFGEAMRLLYIMSSGDSWEEPMWAMMAATEPGHAPVRNDISAAAIFAILWMLVGNFVALNLFVGTVVDNFTRIKKESDASATMTPEQMQWVESMKAMARAKPIKTLREPDHFPRKMLFRLINSSAFDGLITAVIVANIGVMACDYWGIEQDVEVFAKYNSAMTTFAYIYYVEFTIKITAMGPTGYFGDNWCRFDFTLVTCSLLDQFAAELLAQILPIPPMVLRVLRVLRILRILRLLKGAKELRNLIVTMVLSLPSLVNVGAMLALLTFIFAVLGQNLFPFLKHQDSINSMRNFESLGSAMLLLFQCLTGDGWSSLMTEAMLSPESGKCNNELEHPNCGSGVAVPYFISFMLLGSFIFLNLVVAVILENFSSLGNINSDLVSASDVELFKEAWSELDPDAHNYIGAYKLKDLLVALPPPLGVKGTRDATREAISRCFKIKVPTYGGVVYFQDALNCLTHYNYFEDPKTQDMLKLDVGEHETLLSKVTGKVASAPITARNARNAHTARTAEGEEDKEEDDQLEEEEVDMGPMRGVPRGPSDDVTTNRLFAMQVIRERLEESKWGAKGRASAAARAAKRRAGRQPKEAVGSPVSPAPPPPMCSHAPTTTPAPQLNGGTPRTTPRLGRCAGETQMMQRQEAVAADAAAPPAVDDAALRAARRAAFLRRQEEAARAAAAEGGGVEGAKSSAQRGAERRHGGRPAGAGGVVLAPATGAARAGGARNGTGRGGSHPGERAPRPRLAPGDRPGDGSEAADGRLQGCASDGSSEALCGSPAQSCPPPRRQNGSTVPRPRVAPEDGPKRLSARATVPAGPTCLTRTPSQPFCFDQTTSSTPSSSSSSFVSPGRSPPRIGDREPVVYLVTRVGLPSQAGYKVPVPRYRGPGAESLCPQVPLISDSSQRSPDKASGTGLEPRDRLRAVRSIDQQKTFPWVSVPVPLQDAGPEAAPEPNPVSSPKGTWRRPWSSTQA